jgi:hypothetical protein
MQDIERIAIASVEYPARRFDNVAIAPTAQLVRRRTVVGVSDELIDLLEYSLNQLAGRAVLNRLLAPGYSF